MFHQKIERPEREDELAQLARLNLLTPDNQIALSTEPDSNLIVIFGRGLWTPEVLVHHFREMEAAFASKRGRFLTTRVLCDIREQSVQPDAIVEQIREGIERIYTPVDRLATVASSSLVKMQLRRQLGRMNAQYFMSIEAAITWLNAFE